MLLKRQCNTALFDDIFAKKGWKAPFLPSAERERRHNSHDNQERYDLQKQRNGACITRIACSEKGQNPEYYKERRQHRTSPLQIYIPQMSEYDNRLFCEKNGFVFADFDVKTPFCPKLLFLRRRGYPLCPYLCNFKKNRVQLLFSMRNRENFKQMRTRRGSRSHAVFTAWFDVLYLL